MYYSYTGDSNAYKSGDLITARVKALPLLFHRGLVVKDKEEVYVWHNTPMYKNEFGGSVIKETLSEWLKSREIHKCENTNLDNNKIESMSLEMKEKPFHILDFNCEHYVYFIKDNVPKSPQLAFWCTATLSVLFLVALIKISKKTS